MKDKMKKVKSHMVAPVHKKRCRLSGDLTLYLTHSMPPSLAIRLFKSLYKDLFKR